MSKIQLNLDYSAKLHCDKNNLGPSSIIGWALPRQGLWVQDTPLLCKCWWDVDEWCTKQLGGFLLQLGQFQNRVDHASLSDWPRFGPYTGGELFVGDQALHLKWVWRVRDGFIFELFFVSLNLGSAYDWSWILGVPLCRVSHGLVQLQRTEMGVWH